MSYLLLSVLTWSVSVKMKSCCDLARRTVGELYSAQCRPCAPWLVSNYSRPISSKYLCVKFDDQETTGMNQRSNVLFFVTELSTFHYWCQAVNFELKMRVFWAGWWWCKSVKRARSMSLAPKLLQSTKANWCNGVQISANQVQNGISGNQSFLVLLHYTAAKKEKKHPHLRYNCHDVSWNSANLHLCNTPISM